MAKKDKIRVSENKAKDVETNKMQANEMQAKPKTSEELGFLLNQNWQQLLNVQANIQAINKELETRHLRKQQETELKTG